MSGVIVTGPPKADAEDVDALAGYGVATVHEAMGRTGLLGPRLRPIQQGVRIAGTAVTVLCWPGDNLMIHAAVEQCGAGDVLVVTTTSPCTDGMFGELFATALQRRGVRGLVIDAGVRDIAELRDDGLRRLVRGGQRAGHGQGDRRLGQRAGRHRRPDRPARRRDPRRRRRRGVRAPRATPAEAARGVRARRPRRRRPAPPSSTANSAWTATGCATTLDATLGVRYRDGYGASYGPPDGAAP